PRSLTGQYLSGQKTIFSLFPKRRPKQFLEIRGANHNNLKNLSLQIPLGCITAVTGLSGSGKSSLISDTLFPYLSNRLNRSALKSVRVEKITGFEEVLNKVILIDQSPIGKTIRSNPATYVKLLDEIRSLFASLPESQIRGLKAGHFSFNVKEGSCPYCRGLGTITIELDFQAKAEELCPYCRGKRFSEEILAVKFKGKNIFEVLNLEISEAFLFFEKLPSVAGKLKLLKEVGLGYLHLGQSSSTLSGGEAQRIKLAKELSRPSGGKTLYILDEPTTGLHFFDIQKLSEILQNLAQKGNSILLIEHNMELVNLADWVIDLGPGAGKNGGQVLFSGPLNLFLNEKTPTALALKQTNSALQAGKSGSQPAGGFQNLKTSPRQKALPTRENSLKKAPLTLNIKGARQFNLKNLSLKIPLSQLSVFTGPSGSGKTTLAFDTIYAEAQRRYLEAQPLYVRSLLKMPPKPKIDQIENLPPALALEQKRSSLSPRSTIGTMTEIYDHLRVLFTYLGKAFSPETHEKIERISKETVAEHLFKNYADQKIQVLAPVAPFAAEDFRLFLERLKSFGFLRLRLNGALFEIDDQGSIPFQAERKNEIFLVIDRLTIQKSAEKRLLEALQIASEIGKNKLTVALENKDLYFDLAFATLSGLSYPALTPNTFSFNAEEGMCLECLGLGEIYGLAIKPDLMKLTPSQILYHLTSYNFSSQALKLLKTLLKKLGLDLFRPLQEQENRWQKLFFEGSEKFIKAEKALHLRFRGLEPMLAFAVKHGSLKTKTLLQPLMLTTPCPACLGRRLNPLALNVKIHNCSIHDLSALPLEKLLDFLKQLKTDKEFLQPLIRQSIKQLETLIALGLEYLSLERKLPTLSGGEKERIHLAKQLSSRLTSCLYILDEPTIGLHPFHTELLLKALEKLKKQGNTLLLIEHEEQIIEKADKIFDFGPLAGEKGGWITASGTPEEIKKNPLSLTGRFLKEKNLQKTPFMRSKAAAFIEIHKARLNNLNGLSLMIPKGLITAITGLSGAGKSTLINAILKPAAASALKQRLPEIELPYVKIKNLDGLSKVVSIEQHFIGASIRSDVATYSEITPLLRAFFAKLPNAQAQGLRPRHFSSNHLSGMCRSCWGLGLKKIDLQFLPPVEMTCPVCHGYKLNPLSLQIKYKDRHLGELLNLTIEEALVFLNAFPQILEKLQVLQEVGLGYLKLRQELTTLSGGESQRLKLAFQLMKKSRGRILYLFDEPTIGLHMSDIQKLLPIFRRLSAKNHTVVIIEHNLDLISFADYVIDLGPGAGKNGGRLVVSGTPEEIALHPTSYTAKYLRKKLF
ncbi:MAG: excinuclease ABC subunit UvrA, partial [Parachlamydiales bacterium]